MEADVALVQPSAPQNHELSWHDGQVCYDIDDKNCLQMFGEPMEANVYVQVLKLWKWLFIICRYAFSHSKCQLLYTWKYHGTDFQLTSGVVFIMGCLFAGGL